MAHNLKLQLKFLDLIDKLTNLMLTANMAKLANILMANVVDQVLLNLIEKLKNKPYPFVFKVYLLPFVTWFDHSILEELVKSSKTKEAINLLHQFRSCIETIDYDQPITSCIPEFSPLTIPWKEKDNDYTLLVTKHFKKSHDETVLQDLLKIKEDLTSQWRISYHAFHLVAMHSELNYFYWMIPTILHPSLEEIIKQDKQVLWDRGIISVAILPHNYLSDQMSKQSIGYKFDSLSSNLMEDATEVNMFVHMYVPMKYLHIYIIHTYVYLLCIFFIYKLHIIMLVLGGIPEFSLYQS